MKLFSNTTALTVLGVDQHVLYACQCKEFKPITKLYFCRHCTKLRCAKCVTHEVDSFYCPNCLENMPSAEAKLKKNRCANCFDCPSCGNTLSVRATAVPVAPSNPLEDTTQQAPAKKMHYLNCGFCRWTTRDISLPDQVTPSGGWHDREYDFTKKMSALLEYNKHVTHQEKLQKERQKLTKRRTNMYLMDRYGYSISLGKKRGSFASSPLSASVLSRTNSSPGGKQKQMEAPESYTVSECIEPIPDTFYTETIQLENVLDVDQRLQEAGRQPTLASDLYPKHKSLMVRRSYRCKECEHNLCKPEFNPSSIKFKLQLFGVQYCPLLQIVKIGNLVQEEEAECVLSLTNPLDTIMYVTFHPLQEGDLEYDQKTAEIFLPSTPLAVAAKDATVEFDGIGSISPENFDDDPSIVQSRSSNKLFFYCNVKPISKDSEVKVSFKMRYEYKMIVAPLIRKLDSSPEKTVKPEEHLLSLDINVIANLGNINIK